MSTTNGIATFDNIRILTAGSLTLQATSTGTDSATLGTPISITNFVFTIEAVTSSSTPSKNFAFDLTVTLKSEDGLVYLPAATIALTESSGETILGYSPSGAVNGVKVFRIYFETLGAKSLVATCNGIVSNTVSVTVLDQTLKISVSGNVSSS